MSATLAEILHWWNLLFLVPIALAVLLLLMSALTGMGDVEADAPSGNHETDVDNDSDHAPSFTDSLRSFGVGVAPVSLLTQAFLLFLGIWELTANRIFTVGLHPEGRTWIALLVAVITGVITTALFGSAVHPAPPRSRRPAKKISSPARAA